MNEKKEGNLTLHSSRGLTGVRNLIWLDHWKEGGKAAGQYWEVEGKKKYSPLPWAVHSSEVGGTVCASI